jgi:RHH-type proline utilization regulon transcriptional repressor/proline dehydrogenase/delta 1-pyrroline-5-carboxylate dehydrogenase
MMHDAGVPIESLLLLLGGGQIGAQLTKNSTVKGDVFTGSTQTAHVIRHSMAQHLSPGAPLVAETGGLNAMIVDSTALPEQAVRAVVESAFQSAGQRCSALRCLYVQEDIVEDFKEMLFGAMDEIHLADPWALSTDSGPVIDQGALDIIVKHIQIAEKEGRLLKQIPCPEQGTFIGPTLIELDGISDLDKEIFGPVLHIATFRNDQLDEVINDINATGYGLTFGLQTRIDDRVQKVCERIQAGNVYVNRNQIGAIVGSQPFGGNGLSGTGPKAGGPHYLTRFYQHSLKTILDDSEPHTETDTECAMSVDDIQLQINSVKVQVNHKPLNLPGPTGESNRLSFISRGPILCLGPGKNLARQQAEHIVGLGGTAVVCGGTLSCDAIKALRNYSGLIWWGNEVEAQKLNQGLSDIEGPILPLITGKPDTGHVVLERHVCVDTTASGGNTELLSGGLTTHSQGSH